ncbi:adenylate/guanylate cyclase domain-containing protein [Mycobacterium syngnathidarum]
MATHRRDYTVLPMLLVLVVTAAVVAGLRSTRGLFRWYERGAELSTRTPHSVIRVLNVQALVQLGVWAFGGFIYWLSNREDGGVAFAVVGVTALFGGIMAAATSWLITQHVMRPVIAAALRSNTADLAVPGVRARLIFIWILFTAVPLTGIALVVMASSRGGIAAGEPTAQRTILVLVAVAVVFSCRATILVARSISDPLREVVSAMAAVQEGEYDSRVDVYEPSEVGRLQSGFNNMARDVSDRERVRKIFGRYVGVDVAQRALAVSSALSGDVRDVGVLYVDLVGSTAIAASMSPDETARLLNAFFEIVVSAVERHNGLINKFEGDAVLAVFGAPLPADDSATMCLRAARYLGSKLEALPDVAFGIGVTWGAVFAGTLGAENRQEYTVVGDPVNEAARLADLAKEYRGTILCSATTLSAAQPEEQTKWRTCGSVVLRGRSATTVVAEPAIC